MSEQAKETQEPQGLYVNRVTPDNRPDEGEGWYVSYSDGQERRIICFRFARQQDAVAARAAIASLVEWRGSFDEIAQRCRRYDLERIKQAMLDAMAW